MWFSDQANFITGDLVPSVAAARRHDLTDSQWAVTAAVAACAGRSRAAAQMGQQTDHRRDQVAGTHRVTMARRP